MDSRLIEGTEVRSTLTDDRTSSLFSTITASYTMPLWLAEKADLRKISYQMESIKSQTQTQSIAGKNRNPAWRHTDSSDGMEVDTFSDRAKQRRTVPRPDTAIEDDPMTELQRRSQQVREALQQTVARAMETMRRLGQYAVVFKDGKPVLVPPDKLGGVLN